MRQISVNNWPTRTAEKEQWNDDNCRKDFVTLMINLFLQGEFLGLCKYGCKCFV